MSRTPKPTISEMDDAVIACYVHPSTGKEVTTPAERQEVAERWCSGDFDFHHAIAQKHDILPIALLIAALIDIEHPLIMQGTNAMNSLQCSTRILKVMLNRDTVAQPVNSLHSLPVERMGNSFILSTENWGKNPSVE